MTKSPQTSKSPSQLIDARIEELGDWRGVMLSRLRTLVKEADPEIVEEAETYPSLLVGVSLGGAGSCADARLASFLACFSCRRSRSLRSRLSFAIVVFLLPLEAMSGPGA